MMTAGAAKTLADVQTWDAKGYALNARFVSDLAGDVVSWLDPKPGERILDVGCGDGALTEKLVALGCSVVGIDPSPSMIEAAKARGLDARIADVRNLTFDAEFDAVFSNAVLHWVREPEAAVRNMRKALTAGGRFAAEFGGHGNVAAVATALRAAAKLHGGDPALTAPWFYPTPDHYAAILGGAGFKVERIGLYPRPTPLPTGIEGWLETMRKPFFDQFAESKRAEVLADIVELLRPSLCDDQGRWTADYVRLRVLARTA
jgi:trans-aconitate methyltransferase